MVPSELIELLGSSARQLEAADAQLDLDLHRQQRRAAIPCIRSEKSPADCGRRGGFLPLPHMKEREAGLRLTTTPVASSYDFLAAVISPRSRCNSPSR
jgi:hypothetical protein